VVSIKEIDVAKLLKELGSEKELKEVYLDLQ